MLSSPPFIASRRDVERIAAAPYDAFMPHARIVQALEDVAGRHAERWALTGIDSADPAAPVRRWTYAQLVRDVRRSARLFRRLAGGAAAPRVALLLPPVPEAHLALWGAETAGVACPINHQLEAGHIGELLRAFDADLLVALGPAPDLDIDDKLRQIVAQGQGLRAVLHVPAGPGLALRPGQRNFNEELAAEDGGPLEGEAWGPASAPPLAALFHTGGTTGAPKLARHTHRNQLHAAWGAACMYGTRPSDVMLTGFPLFHVAGSFVFGLSTLLAGGEVLLPTRTGMRNAALLARFGDFVERFGVTFLAAVPTVIASLLALDLHGARLRTVRALLTGGSPLPDELAAAFEERHGVPVRNILGMTESAGVIAIEPLAGPRTPGSCGLALPFTELAVCDDAGAALAPGASGILRLRGPQVSSGYTDAGRDAGTFEDGWLISGDIGHLDPEGRVFVTGRAKDVIIRGAHNIDPALIESVLLRHPAVQMAAAVGQPDAYAGELPVAYVVLKPGADLAPEDLIAFATPLIAERPAVPKRIDIVPALPMTAIGKVYKPRLRALAAQQVLAAAVDRLGLASRVEVRLEEASSGLRVRFVAADAGCEPVLRDMMKPYALSWSLELRSGG